MALKKRMNSLCVLGAAKIPLCRKKMLNIDTKGMQITLGVINWPTYVVQWLFPVWGVCPCAGGNSGHFKFKFGVQTLEFWLECYIKFLHFYLPCESSEPLITQATLQVTVDTCHLVLIQSPNPSLATPLSPLSLTLALPSSLLLVPTPRPR